MDLVQRKKKYYQDNTPAHKSILKLPKLNKIKYEQLEHQPYLPDLASTDYYVRGKHISSNLEAISVMKQYFAEFPENHYIDGIKILLVHWNKCIQVKGDYIE